MEKQCGFTVRSEIWAGFKALADRRGVAVSRLVSDLIKDWMHNRYPLKAPKKVSWRYRKNVTIRLDKDLYNMFQNLAYQAGNNGASNCLDRLMSEALGVDAEWSRKPGRPRKDGLEPGQRPTASEAPEAIGTGSYPAAGPPLTSQERSEAYLRAERERGPDWLKGK